MKTILCNFHGKQSSAIGITHNIAGVRIIVPDNYTRDDVRLALYKAGYDNITGVRFAPVDEHTNLPVRPEGGRA